MKPEDILNERFSFDNYGYLDQMPHIDDLCRAMEDYHEQKLNLSGIGSKRPSDQEILQVLDLAQCELRAMLKRNKYMGSTALFAVDNLYEVLKAACASGGEGKGVSVDCECESPISLDRNLCCRKCGGQVNRA